MSRPVIDRAELAARILAAVPAPGHWLSVSDFRRALGGSPADWILRDVLRGMVEGGELDYRASRRRARSSTGFASGFLYQVNEYSLMEPSAEGAGS